VIVFNEQQLNELLGQISAGFRSNFLQVVLFFSAVVLIAAFFVTIHLVQKRRERLRLRAARERRLENLAARLGLSEAERRLLGRLVPYLSDPTKAYLLLTSARTLDRTLERLRSGEAADASVARSLQRKVRERGGGRPRGSAPSGGGQRRRFFRAKLQLRARLKRSDGEIVEAQLGDLSAGGALARISGEPLELGDIVAVAIPLGEGKPVVVRARVVRAAPVRGLASLQFEGVRRGTEDRIVAFVNALGRRQRT
jgi:hypothetical protein